MGPKRLKHYARNCGATLALAHARTGDAAAISGYLGDDKTADHIFADFAERYADLNDQDYGAHSDGIQTGRVFAILDQ
jgi:sugar/nucleoside kinase (ribokinase family)